MATDEPQAVQSTGRRMTLIAPGADVHHDDGDGNGDHDHGSEHGDDDDGGTRETPLGDGRTRGRFNSLLCPSVRTEEYEDDEDNDDYEKYSDEEEAELQADDDAPANEHTFESMQSQYRSGQPKTPTTDSEDSSAEHHLEKRQTVQFASEPAAATTAVTDDDEHGEHIEHDDHEELEEGEYDDEYDEHDFDEEEYEDEEEDVSDIDDAELMQRLDSKYGKLPETVEHSDDDEEAAMPRSTYTSNMCSIDY